MNFCKPLNASSDRLLHSSSNPKVSYPTNRINNNYHGRYWTTETQDQRWSEWKRNVADIASILLVANVNRRRFQVSAGANVSASMVYQAILRRSDNRDAARIYRITAPFGRNRDAGAIPRFGTTWDRINCFQGIDRQEQYTDAINRRSAHSFQAEHAY